MAEQVDAATATTHWYESNLVWNGASIGLGIIFTVIAAMKHDVRWLLIFSWIFCSVGVWGLAKRTKEQRIITILSSFLIGAVLMCLAIWLRPPAERPETKGGSGAQSVPSQPSPQQAVVSAPVLAPPVAVTKRNPKPRQSQSPANDIPKPAADNPTRTVQPPPTVINNAPGGFAVSGGLLDHPEVNNYRNPLPKISWGPFADQSINQFSKDAYRPSVAVGVRLLGTFYNPAFMVKCDVPCIFTDQKFLHGMIATGDSRDAEGLSNRDDLTMAGVSYRTSQMPPGTVIILTFQSRDHNPVKILDVQPYAPQQ